MMLCCLVLLVVQEWSEEQKQAVETMRRTADSVVEAVTALRRAGSLEGASKWVAKVDEVCNAVEKLLPGLAETHWRRAQIRAAAMDDRKAAVELDALLKTEPSNSRARCLRAILFFRDGRKALAAADLDAALKEPKGLPDDVVAVASGLSAWLKGDATKARKLLTGVEANDAIELLARLDVAENHLDAALDALKAGIVRDRGYLPFLEARIAVHLASARAASKESDREEALGLAMEDVGTILKLDPNRASAYVAQGDAMGLRAHKGAQLLPQFKVAVEHFSEALKRDPACIDALLGRANDQGIIAAMIYDSDGEKAVSLFEAAEKDCTEAVRLQPERSDAWVTTACVHSNWARRCSGEEAKKHWATALKALETAVKLDKGLEEKWTSLLAECRTGADKK